LTACAVLALTITNSTKAQDPVITMSLGNYSSYADIINLGTMTIPGNPTGSGYIGIYSFNVTSSGTASVPVGTYWTACLSPDGEIDGGSPAATYYYESFAQANSGINPSAWAWNNDNSNPQYWGIQNAGYLWKQVVGNNNQPTSLNADQATGFVLAMYAALYNSSGYGMLSGDKFNPNFSSGNADNAVQTAYNNDLALLNPNAVENNPATGYVLVPTSQVQNGYPYGQEFIFMTSDAPTVVTAPESAGMGLCAGLGALVLSLHYCVRRKLARA
jgi:hypothetical protein